MRPVLDQYGTRFVPYFPKGPIHVCHTHINTEFNNNEQNKTQELLKPAKLSWREPNETSDSLNKVKLVRALCQILSLCCCVSNSLSLPTLRCHRCLVMQTKYYMALSRAPYPSGVRPMAGVASTSRGGRPLFSCLEGGNPMDNAT